MRNFIKVSSFFFFKTQKEKIFVLKKIRKGNFFPLFLYTLYRMRLTSFILVIRKYYKIKLSYSPYALWLYFHKDVVRKEEEFVNFFLGEGDTFVDAGAHLGTVAFTASRAVGNSGKVIAIEPHPKTFSYLKENSSLTFHKNIKLMNAGVGEKEGFMLLSSSYVSDMNHIGESGIRVRVMTLKSLCSDIKKISLLKLDVEGFELQAVRGFGNDLKKVEGILFESSPSSFERYGYTLRDIALYLQMRGYSLYVLGQSSPQELTQVNVDHVTKTRYEDLVALTHSGKIRFQKKGGKIISL
jgi:FkbM family methyltransferase